jgi:hypothetical protein
MTKGQYYFLASGPSMEPGYRRIITYNNDFYNGGYKSKANII